MSLITIDQLLESVDLDFEPRWVTKDMDGEICIWDKQPECAGCCWRAGENDYYIPGFGCLKLAEFDGKNWQECIYEVPRKTTGKIEKLVPLDGLQHNWLDKINALVDAVNELKGTKNE